MHDVDGLVYVNGGFRPAADASVSVPYLDTVLYLLGLSRDEVEAADAGPDTRA